MIAVGGTSQNGTFEEIRDFEALSEKTQKPLPDYAESGMLSYFAGDRAKKEAPRRAKCVSRHSTGSPDWT